MFVKKKDSIVMFVQLLGMLLLATCCIIAACYGTTASAAADATRQRSGFHSVPKLTREQIAEALEETEFEMKNPWSSTPSFGPYSAGRINKNVAQQTVDRLNALRVLAGLLPVDVSTDMCEAAQKSAVLMASNGIIAEAPSKPSNMSQAFYDDAMKYAGSCIYYTSSNLCSAIDGWMAGGDDGSLGSRALQLQPRLGYVGYGYAKNPSSSWWLFKDFCSASYTSGQSYRESYNFVSWPASGYFPYNIFSGNTWWSVSVNTDIYKNPDANAVQVILTREADGTSWLFYSGRGDFGVSGSMVKFRPQDVTRYTGDYTVSISGLEYEDGTPAPLSYRVQFFDVKDFSEKGPEPSAKPTPTPDTSLPPRDPNSEPSVPGGTQSERPKPVPVELSMSAQSIGFTDVPDGHWAKAYVDTASRYGVVLGAGDSKYNPAGKVTGYEFAAVLLRYLYSDELAKVADTQVWTSKIDKVAERCGIWAGLANMDKAGAITRTQMATMLANALDGSRLQKIKAASYPKLTGQFIDWSDIPEGHRNDVATCVYHGILNGIGSDRFGGKEHMNRAQMAAVFCKLHAVANKI